MNTPEIGSKWTHDGVECRVVNVNKRGRGFQVCVIWTASGESARFRLRDFTKAAKPL